MWTRERTWRTSDKPQLHFPFVNIKVGHHTFMVRQNLSTVWTRIDCSEQVAGTQIGWRLADKPPVPQRLVWKWCSNFRGTFPAFQIYHALIGHVYWVHTLAEYGTYLTTLWLQRSQSFWVKVEPYFWGHSDYSVVKVILGFGSKSLGQSGALFLTFVHVLWLCLHFVSVGQSVWCRQSHWVKVASVATLSTRFFW